jgi:membrane protease subunit HflC
MAYTLGLPPEMIAAATAAASAPPGQKPLAKELEQAIPDFVVPPEAREIVTLGRLKIMDHIKQDAQRALAQDGSKEGQTLGRGIELVDVGLSRIEFVPQVREAAFERAVSLMEAIATKTTSEGDQRKKEIINKTQAEVQKIEGEGKQEANVLRGKADADIIDSYAKAIGETGEFYTFIRTLEAYKEALKGDTRLILTTESSLLRLIKKLDPAKIEPRHSPMASSPPAGSGLESPAAPKASR